MNFKKYLLVLAGPTAVGKTDVAIEIAKFFNTEIISADSRQFYHELSIGTAKPNAEQLIRVKHHLVGHLSIHDNYNVSMFEEEVINLLSDLFLNHQLIVLTGGSGLYIDAVCKGIDEFPDPSDTLRHDLKAIYNVGGIERLKEMLKSYDPVYYESVDKENPNRILRALEVCITTGKPYSEQRQNTSKKRDFEIIKIGLKLPRPELNARIANRTDGMMKNGLLQEVIKFNDKRKLNALNTVGYKELYAYMDGAHTLEQAVEKIKTNTRRYAKRQMTWFNRSSDYTWFEPTQLNEITNYISSKIT